MSAQIDYTTIALITVFTSLCTSIGTEVGKKLVAWIESKVAQLKSARAKSQK